MTEESMNEELRKWLEEHGNMETAEPEDERGNKKEITGRCEVCGARDAKYRCLKCGRVVCPSCYFVMFGLCRDCVSDDIKKKLDGKNDLGIDKIK